MLLLSDKLDFKFEGVNFVRNYEIESYDIYKLLGKSISKDLLTQCSFILYFDNETNTLYEIKNRLYCPPKNLYDIRQHFLDNPSYKIKKSQANSVDYRSIRVASELENSYLSVLLVN